MYYSIRSWKRVKAGAYDSDQKTFDWEKHEYCALYQIRYDSKYKWYDMYRIESNRETMTTKVVDLGYRFTLKDAKQFCENHMGEVFKLDESDLY